jgi:TonB family protein
MEAAMKALVEHTIRAIRAVVLSSAFHLAVILCLLLLGIHSARRVIRPVQPIVVAQIDIAGSSHHVKLPLPEDLQATHTRHPVPDAEPIRKTLLPVPETPLQRSGGGAPRATEKNDGLNRTSHGSGSDAEDMRPAFPVFSPRPPVTDRALLPSTEKKIVVDVNLDASGDVVSESLVKGIGNRLDQIVLDIVKTWRFQPATINGKPVPTQAELIFPFNASYPIADS